MAAGERMNELPAALAIDPDMEAAGGEPEPQVRGSGRKHQGGG